MTPDDITRTSPPDATRDHADAALDAGLAEAFGGETTHVRPAPADPEAGAVIAGKYRLGEKIGEGGMGSVWVASQTEPVKRKVAVKLIKAGMDSKAVLARFEAERQALAVMDHPNIAKVLDGGVHDGRPFFVMELVKGVPITQFCDERKLTPQQRLELFVPVCQAIQHAHQKGVIHRDIKPSNVLVALYDDRPVPKVIDFGVAKATGAALTEHTLETGFGAVVGTPAYMSPEQASLNNLDIDTRSDVYSLGILLYELLTGSPPFTKKDLEKQGLLEMLRVVREEEPPRPSAKLSTADTLPSIAATRGTEPKKLTGLLRSELDWIVMKALEKDRTRRYETANGFAADVQRYLAGEPVHAHPPTVAYRLRKFARRNRPQVIAASLVALALVAGVVGTSLGLMQADERRREAETAWGREAEQRATAEANEREAIKQKEGAELSAVQAAKAREETAQALAAESKAKSEAEAKRGEAERNLAFARKGITILGSVFAGIDPEKIAESGRPLQDLLRENLARVAKDLEGGGIADPLTVAGMQDTLGRSLLNMGDAKLAIVVLAKGLETLKSKRGPDHPDTLAVMNNLAEGYHADGQLNKALPLYEDVLERYTTALKPNHPDTLIAMNNLAACLIDVGQLNKGLRLFQDVLKRRTETLGPDDLATLESMNGLAMAYQAVGQLGKALPLFEEVLKLRTAKQGPDHPDAIRSMNNLAAAYQVAGQVDKAVPFLEEALKRRRARLGPNHPHTLQSMNNLAEGYQDDGRLGDAFPLYVEVVKLCRAKLGPDHPNTLTVLNNLGMAYHAAGQLDKALPLLQDVLKRRTETLGRDHPDTLQSLNNLGVSYQSAAKLDKALPLFQDVFKRRTETLGPDHPDTLQSLNNLAACHHATGQLNKALPLYEEALKLFKEKLGPDHPNTLQSMSNLATGYQDVDRRDKALPLLQEVLERRTKNLGPDHPDTIQSKGDLGLLYCETGEGPKAAVLLKEFVNGHRTLSSKTAPGLTVVLAFVGSKLLAVGEFSPAEEMLRECLTVREKAHPDNWATFDTQSMLGGALLGQKKYKDAEPLLLKGYEGMKEREKDIPKQGGGELRIPDALDRLIELYTATNKPDEAKKYQELRAKYPAKPEAKK